MTRANVKQLCAPAIAVTLATASSVMAAAYDDYVQLRVNDDDKVSSFVNNEAGHWQKKDGSGTFVVEAEGPHPGDRYYVPSPRKLALPAGNGTAANPVEHVFGGDELALAYQFWVTVTRSSASATDAVVRIGNLRLLPNGHLYSAGTTPAILAGTCTVEGTASLPSFWQSNAKAGGRIAVSSTFLGDENAVFEFRSQSKEKNLATFTYSGDASGYFGTIGVVGSAAPARLILATEGGFAMPGTIRLSGDAELLVSANSTATIGNLDSVGGALALERDATVSSLGRLVVTNGFTGSSGLSIPVSFSISAEAETLPLVTFSGGARDLLSSDAFAVSTDGIQVLEPALLKCLAACRANLSLAVTNAADGLSRTLAASHRRMVWQTGETPFAAAGAASWSDNDEVSPDADYYLVAGTTGSSDSYTFNGASLSLCGGSITFKNSTQLHVDDFVWVPGASISTYNQDHTISGKIRLLDVPGETFTVTMWNGGDSKHAFTVASEMSGGGSLTLTSATSASQDTRAFYVLSGINTNFSGRLAVTHGAFSGSNAATYNADPDKYCVTLTVSDARNIGGAMSSFDAAGLTLGAHSLLKVAGSVVFDEPTRGWFIDGVGRINVAEGETVTMTNLQVTYAGEFRKEGAGTLKLGGTARFTEDALETPLAGTNVLAIAEGALMPADATGCDGLAISFASGTKLILDASVEGDLKTYGLYDVKWDAPIAVAGGAALPVEFALPEGFDNRTVCRLGICTVSRNAADTMTIGDFAPTAPRGMKAVVSRVENRDSGGNVVSVSFVCDLMPRGITISIR